MRMTRKLVVSEFVTLDGVMEDPGGAEQDQNGFGDRMNSMPKYVVSSTLTGPTWANTHVIRLEDVEDLEGNLLVAGSQQLVQALFEHRLVDELRLVLYPTAIGRGKRLYEVPVD